jgi:hypothetical protein
MARGEGVVVKRADSAYVTNSRGADWIKVKPEYADQMGEVSTWNKPRPFADGRTWSCWFLVSEGHLLSDRNR